LTEEERVDFGKNISKSRKGRDEVFNDTLKALEYLNSPEYRERLRKAASNSFKMLELINQILQEQLSNPSTITSKPPKSPLLARSFKRLSTLTLGSAKIAVNNNSRKTLTIRLNPTAVTFTRALKGVGLGDLRATIRINGKRSKGPKKPFKKSIQVTLGIS
jgi:hypothetical protein